VVEEKPKLIKGFEELRVFQFTRSLDGKDLTYTTGTPTRESFSSKTSGRINVHSGTTWEL
jgi:hypothetical protein